MNPTSFAILITAACVLADPSGDSAPDRRAFSVDVSFGKPLPRDSDDDLPQGRQRQQQGFQEAARQRVPVTSLDFGSGQSWQPHAPAALDSKGPPPFMPDDAESVEVPTMGTNRAAPSTTTTKEQHGFFQAAMPLVSGVQNMFGQAEQGAEQLLHVPSGDQKAPSENVATTAMKTKTAQATLRLQAARQQELELQAQLAKVKAQLTKTKQDTPEPMTAASTQGSQEPMTTKVTQAPPMQTKAQAKQASSEPLDAKSSKPVEANSNEGSSTPAEAKSKEVSDGHAEAKSTYHIPDLVMPNRSTYPNYHIPNLEKGKPGESTRLKAMDKALRGSGTVETDFNGKFAVTPAILDNQGNVLAKGSAVVVAAAMMALAAYLVKARIHTRATTGLSHEEEESGIE